MTSRAFTVFVDDDEPCPKKPAPKPLTRTPTLVDPIHSFEAGPSSISANEKENLHPYNGSRMSLNNALGSKRKSSVLVTKLHNPPQSKKLKKEDSAEAPTKKRKLASSGSTDSVTKPRKVTRRRKASELAIVEEEVKLEEKPEDEKDEKLAKRLSQSEINSRCYDLTVSPLANVSEAFSQPSTPTKPRPAKTVSKSGTVEPLIRDYVTSASFPSPPPAKALARDRSLPPPVLSTPERKRIYASFTFSSPIKPSPARRNPSSSSIKISDMAFAF